MQFSKLAIFHVISIVHIVESARNCRIMTSDPPPLSLRRFMSAFCCCSSCVNSYELMLKSATLERSPPSTLVQENQRRLDQAISLQQDTTSHRPRTEFLSNFEGGHRKDEWDTRSSSRVLRRTVDDEIAHRWYPTVYVKQIATAWYWMVEGRVVSVGISNPCWDFKCRLQTVLVMGGKYPSK